MNLDPFYPQTLREEELKNKVAADWFGPFDCTRIIGNVDFCVDIPATELALGYESEPALWAEAKAGTKKDIVASFVQLILTIGGGHMADRNLGFQRRGAEKQSVALSSVADVYGRNGERVGVKTFMSYDNERFMLHWIRTFFDKAGELLAYVRVNGQDMQNRNGVFLTTQLTQNDIDNHFYFRITAANILQMAIYFSVRHVIEAIWLNDRDLFLYPNDGWKNDPVFQSDCLVFSLFHGQNRVSCRGAGEPPAPQVNHWIPFTEAEVGAKDCFKSHFMSDLLNGKGTQSPNPVNPVNPVEKNSAASAPLRLCVKENISPAARAVLDAGRELWRYYHAQPGANPNASYYDIRLHFQGVTTDAHGKSKMNPTSDNATYNKLLANLRAAMKSLAANIEPKVYEYGFLLR